MSVGGLQCFGVAVVTTYALGSILETLTFFPIAVFKSSVRITTVSALGVYVDEKFITQSFLYKSGGFIFYVPGLLLLGFGLWWLRRSEKALGKRYTPHI